MVYRVGVKHLSHFLQDVDIFQALSERHLDRIAGLCELWRFSAGDYLGVQNEPGNRLYVIRSGEIVVTTGTSEAGLEVRRIGQRETIPVAVLFEPPLMVTTARAATDGEALVMPRVGLMELCELEPRIGLHIYRAVCGVIMSRYRYALGRLAESLSPGAKFGQRWKGAEI